MFRLITAATISGIAAGAVTLLPMAISLAPHERDWLLQRSPK